MIATQRIAPLPLLLTTLVALCPALLPISWVVHAQSDPTAASNQR